MILEIAQIPIKPGSETAFEAAVAEALPLFKAAKGCHGVQLQRGVEEPSSYTLVVRWAALEDHTVTFRESPAFARWRELAGPHFAAAPQVQHTQIALDFD